MKLGIVGLGRMGGNMTERLRKGGHEVETYARTNPDRTADSLVELAMRPDSVITSRNASTHSGSTPWAFPRGATARAVLTLSDAAVVRLPVDPSLGIASASAHSSVL